jgi:hypothetical protein
VGHYVWYAGVAIVVVSLAMTMAGQPRPSAFGCGVAGGVAAITLIGTLLVNGP